MEIVSISPLRTGSLLWQAMPGTWILTVVCKATYVLAPTESPLASEQEEPNEDDRYRSDHPARSLLAASDLAPFKLRADVLLVGHAFAPDERPVRSLVARMVIGDIDKSIEAVCDRFFALDGRLREGSPFTRMSLSYERAFGGPGTTNPVGVRRDTRDAYGMLPVPNLQPAGIVVTSPNDSFDPIGFGPIAPTWPSRREKLGRHANNPSPRAILENPFPSDIDRTFWNAAPLDQQLSALRNNERIVLENLHPKHPRLVTSLPGVGPRAFIEGRKSGVLQLPMSADTLFIDTDRALCSMTWRGSFQLEHAHERGRVIVGMEQPSKPLAWAEAERLLGRQEKSSAPSAPNGPQPPPAPRGPRRSITVDMAGSQGSGSEPMNPYGDRKEATTEGQPLPTSPPGADRGDKPASRGPSSSTLPFVKPLPSSSSTPGRGQQPSSPAAPSAPAAPPPPAPTPPPLYIAEQVAHRSSSQPVELEMSPGAAPSAPRAESRWASGAMPPLPAMASSAMPPLGSPPGQESAPALSTSKDASDAAALVASNAAAARSAPWDKFRSNESIEVAEEVMPGSELESRPIVRDIVELVWFEPECLPRIRRQPPWRALLNELEERPPDTDIVETTIYRTAAQAEDHRDVFEILVRGSTGPGNDINDAFDRAVRDDGKFVPPLMLVTGDIVFPFDEAEMLKTYVTAATPLASSDDHLKSSIALAKEFLSVSGLAGAPGVAEGLIARIKEAFAMTKRPVPADYLDSHTSRALLEKRCYQRRDVFGGTYLRGLFHTAQVTGVSAAGAGGQQAASGQGPVPAYLPESLAKKLPLLQRFRVRMIVEVNLSVDLVDTPPIALKTVALARSVERPLRK
jgi:hypothetical protein